jgi:hypothetical protein
VNLTDLLDKADAQTVTRDDWQRSLESNISMFHPDAIEAMELLDAITGSLRDHYGHMKKLGEEFRDFEHYAKRLRVAMEELETGMNAYKDEDDFDAHRDQLAREAGW